MKALVTGATGFIGNYVVEELLRRNIDVVASGTSIEKAAAKSWYDKVVFVAHDMKEQQGKNLFDKFHQPDMLIHLAWQGLPNYKQLFHFEEELPRQYQFVKTLVTQGLNNVTITGTCFEYGMQEGELNEAIAAKPDNPYALAKDTLRKFLEQLAKLQPFAFKWVRLFYMYGAGQSPSSVLSQLDKAVANGDEVFNMSMGDQLRDYLPVEKVAENIVNTSLQSNITGIINCSSGIPISIKALVENRLKELNKNITLNLGHYPYPDYEPRNFWGDNTRLKSIKYV